MKHAVFKNMPFYDSELEQFEAGLFVISVFGTLALILVLFLRGL